MDARRIQPVVLQGVQTGLGRMERDARILPDRGRLGGYGPISCVHHVERGPLTGSPGHDRVSVVSDEGPVHVLVDEELPDFRLRHQVERGHVALERAEEIVPTLSERDPDRHVGASRGDRKGHRVRGHVIERKHPVDRAGREVHHRYVPAPEEIQERPYRVERGRTTDRNTDHGSGRARGCRERPGVIDNPDVIGGPGTVEGNRNIFVDGLIRTCVGDGRCHVGRWGQGPGGGRRQQ